MKYFTKLLSIWYQKLYLISLDFLNATFILWSILGAPHSWIYNILPHYRIYNSKLISKKFPKKLKALLVDIQLRTGNFSRFQQSSRALLVDIQLRTGNFLDSRKVPKPYYKIYSLNLKFPLCQKAVTYFIYMYCKVPSTKGQLISKCPFGVIIWTKIPTNFFPGFLPQPLKRGQIKKVV